MSTNKDLLKQAIAEAKTIREAAIANAKEALEESLTPHLKEMLAQKLQEMENDEMEEEIVNEEDMLNDPQGHSAHGNIEEAEEDEDEPVEDEEEVEGEQDQEGEEEEEDLNIEDMSVEDLKDLIRDIVAQETGAGEEGMEDELPADDLGAEDMTGMEDGEEEIDINELLRELEEGEVDEEEIVSEKKDDYMEGMKKPKMEAMKKPNPMEEDLNEALKTVSELRKQLQEVNLLNAKLLYVNKVFKANNLTEGQKVNVVAAFDKAETVKEVKLVYETVSKNVVAKQPAKPAIKEHRSFASKPAGSTQKQVINEVSEAVTRMQILAGIKPRQY
jgi:hypothetical protein